MTFPFVLFTAFLLAFAQADVKVYDLTIDQGFDPTLLPRSVITINGQSPGPALSAFEGDTLVINVVNKLNVPSLLHWHGIFHQGTNGFDGVPSLTQCTIPSSQNITYTFKAEPAGTMWYHGHTLSQTVDGLYGPLIIYPRPVSPSLSSYSPTIQANAIAASKYSYTQEITLMVTDWLNVPIDTALQWYLTPASQGNEPPPDAIMVNGVFGVQNPFLTYNFNYSDVVRVRIINTAALSMYKFSIDSMIFQIIEADGSLIDGLWAQEAVVNVAQRLSLLVNLGQLLSNPSTNNGYSTFFRFNAQVDMYAYDPTTTYPPYEANQYPYITRPFLVPTFLGVFSVSSATSSPSPIPLYDPTNSTLATALSPEALQILNNNITQSLDNNYLNGRPLVAVKAPKATHTMYMEVEFFPDQNQVNRGHFNGISLLPTDPMPLLYRITNNISLPVPLVHPDRFNRIQHNSLAQYYIPANSVVDMFINNTDTGEHPFHMHGTAFWIIATSDYPQAEFLFKDNYLRRDVVSVPALGWAKIRFDASNPGVWAFHCHIDYHMQVGLFSTLVIAPELVAQTAYPAVQKQNCAPAVQCPRAFPYECTKKWGGTVCFNTPQAAKACSGDNYSWCSLSNGKDYSTPSDIQTFVQKGLGIYCNDPSVHQCPPAYPYLSYSPSAPRVCFATAAEATHGSGPVGSWCALPAATEDIEAYITLGLGKYC